MQLPLFYISESPAGNEPVRLSEETSRHAVSVMRMQQGDELKLTDGAGKIYRATIVEAHKKHATVSVLNIDEYSRPPQSLTIAISLLKNASRFEWFLEKATELGITKIVPLITSRTEKQHYKEDRALAILVSAMIQSGQAWLPELSSPQKWEVFVNGITTNDTSAAFIGHCVDTDRKSLADELLKVPGSRMVMIGPEGDFTDAEISLALRAGAIPVTLGDTRLRAETSGIIAATLIALVNSPGPV